MTRPLAFAFLFAAAAFSLPISARADGKAPSDPANPGPVLYIQGSEVNLRSGPSKSHPVSTKVQIGTQCSELSSPPTDKSWIKLKCGELEGFTLRALASRDVPDFDALLARATLKSASPQARFDAASRASFLKPDSSEATAALRTAFFDLQFSSLKIPDYQMAWSSEDFGEKPMCPDQEDSLAKNACLLDFGFSGVGYAFSTTVIRKTRFVHAAIRLGKIHVIRGHYHFSGGHLMAQPVSYDEWDVNQPLADAIASRGEKHYQGRLGEGPFWKFDPEAVKVVGTLPSIWSRLQGDAGHREYRCVGPPFIVEVHFSSRDIQVEQPSETTEIAASPGQIAFTVKWSGRQRVHILQWPTNEPYVGLFDGAPYTPVRDLSRFPERCPP